LAAIAANQGNWIEARDYLELALKLRPTYAIAAANLGEIYIRLGAQAYENAAKGAQTNQRQYTLRAKALLDVLKPPARRPAGNIPAKPVSANDATQNSTSSTNLPESRPSNGQSTVKN
jgi:tetratricopeptide (TPR) repeat protein